MRVKVYTGSYIVDSKEGPHLSFHVEKAWIDTHNNSKHFDLCFEYRTMNDLERLREKLAPLLNMEEVESKYYLQGCVEVYLPCKWRVVFGE